MPPEIEALLERATELARQGGRNGAALEHLLLAILDDPAGAAILANAGANVDELRTQTGWIVRGAPKRDHDVRPWLEAVGQRGLASGRGPLSIPNILAELMSVQMASVTLLAEQGVTRVDVLNVIAHGVARSTSIPTARLIGGGEATGKRGQYQIVFHNDPFTTFRFVCQMLERHVGLGQGAAIVLAHKVNQLGSTAVGPYKLKQALRLIEAITGDAYAAGHPLKLSCEALPG